ACMPPRRRPKEWPWPRTPAGYASRRKRPDSWLTASEGVAQIAHFHPFAKERHTRNGNAVAGAQSFQDFDLATCGGADFHRAATDDLIWPNDPGHLLPFGVLVHGRDGYQDAIVENLGTAICHGDRGCHPRQQIHADGWGFQRGPDSKGLRRRIRDLRDLA